MSAEGYSIAVYTAIKNGVKPAEALKRLTDILARQGHSALYPRILKTLERSLEKEEGKDTMTVRIAREKDAKTYKSEIAAFREAQGLSGEEEVIVDETIVGGYVLEGKGARTDASYKTSLISIYKSLIN